MLMKDFGCMMVLVDLPNWEEIKAQVDQADIYDPDGDHGFASKPHVTAMYGFHQVDIHEILEFMRSVNPIKASLCEVSLFENDKYDVLKVSVESDDLHAMHGRIRDLFKVTEYYPTYQPHMTICYLNKGAGKKYLDGRITGIPTGEQIMNKVDYEDPIGQKLFVNFANGKR